MDSGGHIDDPVDETTSAVEVEVVEDLSEAGADVSGLMSFASGAEEEGGGVGVGEALGSELEIGFEVSSDFVIEGDDSVFAELAFSNGEGFLGEVHVGGVEVCELGDSEAAGVDGVIGAVVAEPHEVAARVEWVGVDGVELMAELALENACELFDGEDVRDQVWVLYSGDALEGIAVDEVESDELVAQAFGGVDPVVVGPGAQAVEERVLVVEDDLGGELFGTSDARGAKELDEVAEVFFQTLMFVVDRAGKPQVVLDQLSECLVMVVSREIIPVFFIGRMTHGVLHLRA